jgi:hypothetical protein
MVWLTELAPDRVQWRNMLMWLERAAGIAGRKKKRRLFARLFGGKG